MSGFDLPPLSGQPLSGQPVSGQPLSPRLIGEAPRSRLDTGGAEGTGSGVENSAFGNALAAQLEHITALQQQVTHDTEAMAMGKSVGVDKLMMSIGKSEVAFNLMLEVRNKLVDAWEKLSRSVV